MIFIYTEDSFTPLAPMLDGFTDLAQKGFAPYVVAGLLLIVVCMGALLADPLLGFLLWMIAGSVIMNVIEHYVLGFPYPVDRTSLYLNPLGFLAVFRVLQLITRWLSARGSIRTHEAVRNTGLVFLILFFLYQLDKLNYVFHVNYPLSPPVKETVELLRDEHSKGGGPVLLAYSDSIRPEFQYYKESRELDWLELALLSENDSLDRVPDYYFFYDFNEFEPGEGTMVRQWGRGRSQARLFKPSVP